MPYVDRFPECYGSFQGGGSVTIEFGVGVIRCTHGAGTDAQGQCVNCGSADLSVPFVRRSSDG